TWPVPPAFWPLHLSRKYRKACYSASKGTFVSRDRAPGRHMRHTWLIRPAGRPGSGPGRPGAGPCRPEPAGPFWNGPRYTTDQPRTPQSYPAEQNFLLCYDGPMPRDPAPRPATPLPGRQAEAARNDQLILDAARAVFIAAPAAPVSEVAKRAGVGIAALYRRY